MKTPDPYPKPRRPEEETAWPESWRESFLYDRLEVWGERFNRGYALSYLSRRQRTIELMETHCPAPASILDLAAAQGNFTVALSGLGYTVTWNDLRSELADYARKKLPDSSEVKFVAGNIFELGSTHHGAYDAVVALEVIEHVAHPDDFLRKLAKLVKPGGIVVISTPNGGYFLNDLPRFSDCPDPSVFESVQFKPNSDGHIFLIHEDEMRRFASDAGLEMLELDLITNPLTAGHMKLRYLLNVLPERVVIGLEWLSSKLPRAFQQRMSNHMVVVLSRPGAPAD